MPTVTGDIKQIAGTAVTSGEVRFTATKPVVQDPTARTTSLATSVAEHVVTLDGSGFISTTLPATGDDWVYRVEIVAHVGSNRVSGLPRLLLEVPASGADISDAGVEGAPSGRVVVNRLVGNTELSAAVAPIDAKADSAVAMAQAAEATVERLDTDVTLLKERDSLAPGQVVDQETALVLNDPNSQSNAVLNAQTAQAIREGLEAYPVPEQFATDEFNGAIYSVSTVTGKRRKLVDDLDFTEGPHDRGVGIAFSTAENGEQWVPYRGGDPRPTYWDPTRWSVWGSSTAQGFAEHLAPLAADRGAALYNGGVGGTMAQQILARLGSRPVLTAAQVTIPASGATAEFATTNMRDHFTNFTYPATLAGVEGTMSRVEGKVSRYTFTRATAGSQVIAPAGSPVMPINGHAYRQGLAILNIGKNDLTGGVNGDRSPLDEVIQGTHDAFDWMGAIGQFTLVMGHFVDSGVAADAPEREEILFYNAAMEARYKSRYIDLQGYITGPDVWTDTGITPTQADLDAQAAGNKPPSLSLDALHLNAAAYTAVTNRIAALLDEMGWEGGKVTLAADNFDRPDSTTLGNTPIGDKPWAGGGGQVAISGNQLSGANVTTNHSVTIDAGTPIYEASATLAATGTDAATSGGGIIVRHADDQNYHWLSLRVSGADLGLKLNRYVGGTYSAVGPNGPVVSVGDTIAVRSTPTTISVHVNGELAFSHDTAVGADNTGVGFQFHTQGKALRWDDFKVTN